MHAPGLGNMSCHPDVGAPLVAGVSLQPLSPAQADRFRSLGAEWVIPANRAEAALLEVATAPAGLSGVYLAALDTLLKQVRDYPAEAARLLPPIAGDEASVIAGMIKNLDDALPTPPAGLYEGADFLRQHLNASHGLATTAIAVALGKLDSTRAKIAAAESELSAIRVELGRQMEQATAPESIEDARRRRVSAKAARLMPALIADMERLRDEAAGIVGQLDKTLLALRGVA
ncbi:MAG TPA: hypothetical protein VKQ27_05505 [Acetobacteraceae bacterium]|nr:hypothetical protein [Acetobacteraceae bacterium]